MPKSQGPAFGKFTENKKTGYTTFELQGVHRGYANALRRTLLSNIPIYGLNSFNIKENNSRIFHDDMLKHIISGVPLVGLKPNYDYSSLLYKLEKKVEKDGQPYHLKSDDIIAVDGNDLIIKDLPLFTVLPGESVSVELRPELGYAKDDAHIFGATTTVRFKLIESKSNKYKGENVELYEFSFKPIRNWNAKQIVKFAVSSLLEKFQKIQFALERYLSDGETSSFIEIEELDKDYYIISINDADHTEGYLITREFLMEYPDILEVKDDKTNGCILYNKVHPTEDRIEIKLRSKNAIKRFKKVVDDINVSFETLAKKIK